MLLGLKTQLLLDKVQFYGCFPRDYSFRTKVNTHILGKKYGY